MLCLRGREALAVRRGQVWEVDSKEGAPVGSWRRVTSYQDNATSNAATATLELVSL